jgi:hypothetical protein
MGRAYSTHGSEGKCIKDFDGKAKGKRSLGRHRRRWEDNNKMDSKEIG